MDMYVALIGSTFFDDIDFYVVRRNIPIAFEIVSHTLPNLFKPVINLKPSHYWPLRNWVSAFD